MDDNKLRVLVATHIGEPVGGIAINYQTLLASSFSQQLDVRVVETSQGNLSFSQRGKFRLVNVFDVLKNTGRFMLALRFRSHVVDIGSSCGASFIIHGIMALLARLVGVVVVFHL